MEEYQTKITIAFVAGLLAVFILGHFFLSAPSNFPSATTIGVEEGESLSHLSLNLKESHIIRSPFVFKVFVILYGGEKHVISADYFFESKLPVYEVARRISTGDQHLAPIKVTIPEGFTTQDIADTFTSKLSHFNKENFLLLAKDKEGYLFPDTYFFLTAATENEVFKTLTANYEKKVAPLRPEIIQSGKSEKQIIVMASLLEKEAEGDIDRGIIAGILWKRVSIGMALQVDAAPDTYRGKGLPASPISNPGIEAITAAIHPVATPYLYYLHDKTGMVHYARTFEEHKMNVSKYL